MIDGTVGVDEAGRGCMIGRVYAAAVIWNPDIDSNEIKDSKKLSRKRQSALRKYIETHAVCYGVGWASSEEIDALNISNATFLAMHRALDQVEQKGGRFDRILVDGNRFQPYKCPHQCIVGGDNLHVNIAAASILAKEHHDEWIDEEFKDDEKYDLLQNKGYGTKKHIEGIRVYGTTVHHRKLFCAKYTYF